MRWNVEGHYVTLEETNDNKAFTVGKRRLDIEPVDDAPLNGVKVSTSTGVP